MIEVKNLSVTFKGMRGHVQALRDVTFHANQGEILGIVGESGSGKSVTALSILGLLPKNGEVSSGEILFKGNNLIEYEEKALKNIRGKEIGMVFQEPMTALHPTMKIGQQLGEVIRKHHGVTWKVAKEKAIDALKEVHIHHPEKVAKQYPFELSGGMRQRIVIALAMCAPPQVLIADEATTALDVTIQGEILKLIKEVASKHQTTVLLITHDLGVVAEICDRVVVMYGGEIVEEGKVRDVLTDPLHPYTEALIHALPDLIHPDDPLMSIPGDSFNLYQRTTGCNFASRCHYKVDSCLSQQPTLVKVDGKRAVACPVKRESGLFV